MASSEDATIAASVEAAREAAAKKMAEAVNAEKVKAFDEKQKLTEQLADMQRRLERRTAHELGDPGEIEGRGGCAGPAKKRRRTPKVIRAMVIVGSRNVALNFDLARPGVKAGPSGETATAASRPSIALGVNQRCGGRRALALPRLNFYWALA